MQFSEMEIRQLILWENMYADEYLRHTQADINASQEQRIHGIDARSVITLPNSNSFYAIQIFLHLMNLEI